MDTITETIPPFLDLELINTFLKIEFKLLSCTRKQIVATTSTSLLLILATANVLSLKTSSSAFVDFHFLVKSRKMLTLFTQRCYPLTSLQ